MHDLGTALALLLVVEGLLWALFPDGMKRAMATALQLDSQLLRWGGLVFATVGVMLVWLIRS
ncbi:MAG: DUF2065 domain-containing protein [Geminicoccaceae bacterium]|nr:DUF2065 domain-containing protein [Geminicoccaceae bacterium]MCB9945554.1 DUF2065 domain-containing protein [Geminicoccaceae bacterium]